MYINYVSLVTKTNKIFSKQSFSKQKTEKQINIENKYWIVNANSKLLSHWCG